MGTSTVLHAIIHFKDLSLVTLIGVLEIPSMVAFASVMVLPRCVELSSNAARLSAWMSLMSPSSRSTAAVFYHPWCCVPQVDIPSGGLDAPDWVFLTL